MPKQHDPKAKVTEILGHYNPRRDPRELVLKVDRIKHWLEKGAEATDTVWNLLVEEKIVEGKKRGVTHISQKRQTKMGAKEEAKKEAEAQAKQKAEEVAKAKAEAAKAEAEKLTEAPAPVETAEDKPAEEPKAEEAIPAQAAVEEKPVE